MSSRAPLSRAGDEPTRARAAGPAPRVLFVVLLALTPFMPHIGSSFWTFPAVSSIWVLLPFCGLFLLPLLDPRHPWRIRHLDLLVMLAFIVALGGWGVRLSWPLLFIYAPLIYLGLRMASVARVGRREPGRGTRAGGGTRARGGT